MFKLFFYIITALMFISCSKSEVVAYDGGNKEDESNLPVDSKKDTLEFVALVYANDEVVNSEMYGGEEKFREGLNDFFYFVTEYWNESENEFDYYFKYSYKDLILYPTPNKAIIDSQIGKSLNSKYDFVVRFDLDAKSSGASHGGAVWIDRTKKDQENGNIIYNPNKFEKKEWDVYASMTHELGHYRGCADLYQYNIPASQNPINNTEFRAEETIMNNSSCWKWGSYCSAVINYTAKMKRLPDDFMEHRFPNKVELHIVSNGKPCGGVTVRLWGCRAYGENKDNIIITNGDPDVYAVKPFREFRSGANGVVTLTNIISLYNVDKDKEENLPQVLPWGNWNNFLIEAESPSGAKGYSWMPEYELIEANYKSISSIVKKEIEIK